MQDLQHIIRENVNYFRQEVARKPEAERLNYVDTQLRYAENLGYTAQIQAWQIVRRELVPQEAN